MNRFDRMKEMLSSYKGEVEGYLKTYIEDRSIPSKLREAMKYSLLAGGKRIRPILCLVWNLMCGGEIKQVLPFACSIELIHTYSLIHDDLPAMDDDDMRRGRPSNHVVFGEAMAILAGDGLLTDSFYLMLKANVSLERLFRAMGEVLLAAGPRGMVGGQALDMMLTGKGKGSLEELQQMHLLKTGALICASCVSGVCLASARHADIENARRFGRSLGIAFQIADDLLDVVGDEKEMGKPVGSDERQGKLTYPQLVGIEESRRLGWEMVENACKALEEYGGMHREFLEDLAHYVMTRTS